jgi:hypothetical protein
MLDVGRFPLAAGLDVRPLKSFRPDQTGHSASGRAGYWMLGIGFFNSQSSIVNPEGRRVS